MGSACNYDMMRRIKITLNIKQWKMVLEKRGKKACIIEIQSTTNDEATPRRVFQNVGKT